MKLKNIITIAAFGLTSLWCAAQSNVIEEVAWIIGDEPIYKSEIEEMYQDMQNERTPITGVGPISMRIPKVRMGS